MLDHFFTHEVAWALIGGEQGHQLVLPGSFNPLHRGHTTLAELASQRFGLPVAFELSVANVDKPELTTEEVKRRLDQFQGRYPIFVTRAATFRQKAGLFPGCVFVVGVDTAERIVHPHFYGDDEQRMIESLEAIRSYGCRFFVGGRADAEGRFVDVEGVAIPENYRELFAGVGEAEFRVDVSSSAIRASGVA